jgi:hypothetical protein
VSKCKSLNCRRIQCDEIWTFFRMKQARIRALRIGPWTFVAIDPDTRSIPAYRVGKRTRETAVAFMPDLSSGHNTQALSRSERYRALELCSVKRSAAANSTFH